VSLAFGIPPNLHEKKRRTALFGHYRAASQNPNAYDEPSNQLTRYIILINSDSFDSTAESSALSKLYSDFALLQPLFQRLFCVPVGSAPVERVFSQSGLIMSSHRAHMSNAVLECLLFKNVMQTIRPNEELIWTSE